MEWLIELISDDQVQNDHFKYLFVLSNQVIDLIEGPPLKPMLTVIPLMNFRLNQGKYGPSFFDAFIGDELKIFCFRKNFPESLPEKCLLLIPQFNLDGVVMQTKFRVYVTVLFIQNAVYFHNFFQQIYVQQVDREERRWTLVGRLGT